MGVDDEDVGASVPLDCGVKSMVVSALPTCAWNTLSKPAAMMMDVGRGVEGGVDEGGNTSKAGEIVGVLTTVNANVEDEGVCVKEAAVTPWLASVPGWGWLRLTCVLDCRR